MITLAADRGPYICQSQSLNLYMPNPEHRKMTAMHFYGWEKGLKTGQYYLRSRPAVDAIKFTVNMESLLAATETKDPDAIIKALNKVKEIPKKVAKPKSDNKSVNLGRKATKPAGGFGEDGEEGPNKI